MHASILKPFAAAEQEQSSPADRLHPPAGRPPAPEQTHQSCERAPAYLKDLQTGQNRIQQKLQRRSELPRPRPNISGSDSTGRARPELRRRKDAHEHGHMHSTTIYPKAIRGLLAQAQSCSPGKGHAQAQPAPDTLSISDQRDPDADANRPVPSRSVRTHVTASG